MIYPRMTTYNSNGKLLITGEYLILKGAMSLAVPVNFGQSMEIIPSYDEDFFQWFTYQESSLIFKCCFTPGDLSVTDTSSETMAQYLRNILLTARDISRYSDPFRNIKVKTTLDFNIYWGLGSSSSLISNISRWLDIDPFDLLFKVNEGSGYDVACARSEKPLIYKLDKGKPWFRKVDFLPPFHDKLFFIYLGKKQDTLLSVKKFLSKERPMAKEVKRISEISTRILKVNDLSEFDLLLSEHESIIATVTDSKPIKSINFHDFPGTIKSLGAWGGDFILVSCREGEEMVIDYFRKKKMKTVFTFKEMVKSK